MAENSNIDELMSGLQSFVDGFNFQRKGVDQSLGRDIVMTIIRGPEIGQLGGIMGRVAAEVTPEGEPWPPNSPEYAERKEKEYGWAENARRTGQTMSQESLYGGTTIGEHDITMRQGTGTPPGKSVSPNSHLGAADERVDDRQKGLFLTAQGRKFYGFNDEDRKNVIAVAQQNLNEYIHDRNQANGTD